ncbi:hypothetical protein GCK72_026158 [Caenorhabditis remanei]|uniref:Uncharacterized protein n=1 Tax=Caenorhabditis remanei TaxID=31234 RepID=A0A6A5G432_CAERE|nr:hypothetical protein GCK72_026158 [Caenorhabditis remanei]KAF1749690.1 hypothetical protein GCK72_026158 [Caenorhabditis remanei]
MPKDATESLIDHSGYTKPEGKPVMQRASKREIPTKSEISSEASGSQEEDPPISRSSLNAPSVRHLSPGDPNNEPSASKKSRVELEVAQKLLPIHDSAYHSNEQQPPNCLPANPHNPVTSNSEIFPKPANGYNWEMSHIQKHHVNTHENLTEKCILPDHPDLLSPTPIEKIKGMATKTIQFATGSIIVTDNCLEE